MNDFLIAASEKIAFLPGILFALFTILMIHELGHYWAARIRHMRIETFSIGIGKKLWSLTDHHGTEWIFRLIPIGGHVQITDLTLDETTNSRRGVWTRLFVVLAGPGANFLLPFVILPLCFLLIGLPIRPPIITAAEKGTPAHIAGLQHGDIVTHVDDKKILSYNDFGDLIKSSEGNTLKLTINRHGQEKIILAAPEYREYIDLTGIKREHYFLGTLNALLPLSFDFVLEINGENTEDLADDVLREKLRENLGKPIEIGVKGIDDTTRYYDVIIPANLNTHLSDPDHKYKRAFFLGPINSNAFVKLSPIESIQRGIWEAATLLWHIVQVPLQIFPIDPQIYAERVPFMSESEYYYESLIYRAAFQTAMLSIVIAFINLIPFPRLDGDFVLTYLMEAKLNKKPSRKQRALAIGISLFAIYCLVLFANLGDIPGYIEMKLEDWENRMERWNE